MGLSNRATPKYYGRFRDAESAKHSALLDDFLSQYIEMEAL